MQTSFGPAVSVMFGFCGLLADIRFYGILARNTGQTRMVRTAGENAHRKIIFTAWGRKDKASPSPQAEGGIFTF